MMQVLRGFEVKVMKHSLGGHTTSQMKNKLRVPQKRPLADFLPTITIAAKNLATEMTNFTVKNEDLSGEQPITKEHMRNNTDVRTLLGKRNIKPEELPPEEDIKRVEKRVKREEKTIAKSSQHKKKLATENVKRTNL